MTPAPFQRRLLTGILLGAFALLLIAILARRQIAGLVVDAGLKWAGASDVGFKVIQASPVRLVLADLGFKVPPLSFAAERVSLVRSKWWVASLGALEVEKARVPVRIDEVAKLAASPAKKEAPAEIPSIAVPLESVQVDGELVIQADGLPEQALVLTIKARQSTGNKWEGGLEISGPGMDLKAAANYDPSAAEVAFQVSELALDLKPWQGFVQRVVPFAGQDWAMAGKITGHAQGRMAGDKLAGTASVRLREVSLTDQVQGIAAAGVEADLEFVDLAQPTTKPGRLRVRELRTGDLTLRDLAAEFALDGADRFVVSQVSLQGVEGQLSDGPFQLTGKFTGRAEGKMLGENFVATATAQLRDGSFVDRAQDITAEGIDADLEFSDLVEVISKPGTLRVRDVRSGKLAIRDVVAEFALEGSDRVVVSHVSLQALGGTLSAEPFHFVPSRPAMDAVLLAKGIRIEAVLALTDDLPAEATGRVEGRVPVRIDEAGFRFGTGWLALEPGVNAEVKFDSGGLLTRGVSPSNPRYAVLQKIESGLLKLRVNELRLDIRPADAPAGRSARLHLAGAPVDPEVKAPVTLDLNVNGPLESLLNLGLDSRISFGTKPPGN